VTINLLEDVAPASNELGAIAEAAQRVLILQDEINELERQKKDKAGTLKKLTEQEMPDLMHELNVKDFTLTDGSQVKLTDIVNASIPSAGAIERAKGDHQEELYERQQQAFDWLRKNGGADLIKSSVEVQFGKGEDDACSQFKKDLRTNKIFYRDSMGVHPQQLKAFVKECLMRGKNVPDEIFQLYTGQKVQIRRP
jgi:hypothetical protein|tara:strand:- start:956 stop:1543 length:588 start_codon:yes stop_codon:yes gene_type:complete